MTHRRTVLTAAAACLPLRAWSSSSRPVHAEDYGLSESDDNRAALQQAIDAARESSRRLMLPPGHFPLSGELRPDGVDIRGVSGASDVRGWDETGTHLALVEPWSRLIRYTGEYNGRREIAGALRDVVLDTYAAGSQAILGMGDAVHQPDHLRLERIRLHAFGPGWWDIGMAFRGKERSKPHGIRAIYMSEIAMWSVYRTYLSLNTVHDAYVADVRCYVPLGKQPGIWFTGDSRSRPSGNTYAYGLEAPLLVVSDLAKSRIVGNFSEVRIDSTSQRYGTVVR